VAAPSGKSYILTNRHICNLRDKENRLTVRFPKMRRTYDMRVIEISKKHDLCLVESVPSFKKTLKVSSGSHVGQGVFVVGHPKLYGLTVAEGEYIEEAEISVVTSKKIGGEHNIVHRERSPRKGGGGFLPTVVLYKSARFHVYSRGGNSGSPIVNFKGNIVSVLFAGNRYDVMETYGVPYRYITEFLEGY
jgi:hypothetical protein